MKHVQQPRPRGQASRPSIASPRPRRKGRGKPPEAPSAPPPLDPPEVIAKSWEGWCE